MSTAGYKGSYRLFKTTSYHRYKRLREAIFIILFSPIILFLMILIAAAIKFTSKGPILFIQNRVGKNGEIFRLYKFRSMQFNIQESKALFAEEDNEHVTSLVNFLRKTHLDELPQFWNILKGEMRLIGPRPEQPYLVKQFNRKISFYSKRHEVRPGITGLAQVKTGDSISLSSTRKKLKYDLFYLKNMSLMLDFSIIAATIRKIMYIG